MSKKEAIKAVKAVKSIGRHKKSKKVTLKRDLGLLEATFAGVGIILGAGIYALIGQAAGIAGNAVWLSFLISAVVAAFTGLSYAELSSMFTKDAGEYLYTEKALGRRLAFVVGFFVILEGIISAATVALGFAGYFKVLVGVTYLLPIAIGCIILFSVVNYRGIKESAFLNIIMTLLEAAGLFLIILLGIKYIGSVDYMSMAQGMEGVLSAAALIFFAYIGFESVIKLSEETRSPAKTIPKALVLSIIISTILYVLVAISAVSIIGWEQLGQSEAPLADVAAAAMGSTAFLVLSIIALFSTANTVLIILVVTSRIMYGMACESPALKQLTKVHPKRRTPWVAVFFTMLLTMLFVMFGDIRLVAEMTNFVIFAVFIAVNIALIVLRYKKPKLKRPFRVPLNIGKFPVLGLMGAGSALFMIFYIDLPAVLMGLGMVAVGFVIYEILQKFS